MNIQFNTEDEIIQYLKDSLLESNIQWINYVHPNLGLYVALKATSEHIHIIKIKGEYTILNF